MKSSCGETLPPVVVVAGSDWGGTLGTIRSLGRRGVPVHVISGKKQRPVYASSRYVREVIPLDTDGPRDMVADGVVAWAEKRKVAVKPLLVPHSDWSCADIVRQRARVEEYFRLAMPSTELVMGLQNKAEACALAEEHGLDVPPYASVASPEDLRIALERTGCPAVMKPLQWSAAGERPFRVVKVDRASEFMEKGAELLRSGATLIVQQYVPGEDQTIEVCMFYRSLDGRQAWMCTGFKKRQFPPGQGIMAYGEARDLPELAGKSRRFIEGLDYRGLGGIEFKRCKGKDYFIEMSTRPEAFHALAIRAGVDLPWYAYSDVVLGRPEGRGDKQSRACYVDEAALLGLLRHHRREVALFREVRPYLFRRNTVFALWDMGDLLPWVFFLAMRVAWFSSKSLRVPAGRHRAS